jgi:hypothetical protein
MRSCETDFGQSCANWQSPPVLCWNRKPRLREPLSCCLVLCGLGVRVSPHRALGAPSSRCAAWWRPRYAQKPLARACAPPPKFTGVAMESCLLVRH